MKYKIGDVARILGISSDLIRYYEEKGVVKPEKDPSNNYRYYDTWDINYLIDCLWYKNFGFGIERVARMVTEGSYDTLVATLAERSEALRESIRREQLLLQRIEKFAERLDETMSYVGRCELRENAPFCYYINRHNAEYDNQSRTLELSRRWLKYMPFTRRYFEVPETAMTGGGDDYVWGFSVGRQYIEAFGIDVAPPVLEMPQRTCIHSAFRSAGHERFSARKLDFLLDYAREHDLTPARGAFGNLACSVIEAGEQTGYFEVWLPVE
ncbi:MAG: MerR family transcriptional regulator [Oscillospiraceae bacterium]|jgi:DNA-binding transcriptional MerR regulator|nr:MerR family transcriptional regulator [Oscillospiraceae bacterium]